MQTLFVIATVIVAVSVVAWYFWPKVAPWFKDSETIFVARLHVVVGAAWWLAQNVDSFVPLLNLAGYGKVAAIIVAIQGVVLELARRNRATDL